MDSEHNMLLASLAQAVADRPLMFTEKIDWVRFAKLSKVHAVAPLVYYGLQKAQLLAILPDEILAFFRQEYHKAIYKDTQIDYIKKLLSQKMEEENISHIFLKGAILKHDYPEPALRTMCDLDVLVYATDFGSLGKIAENLGGTPVAGDGNHRNYRYNNGVEIEFHPNLLHHDTPVGTGINPGWQYAKEDAKVSEKELTEEGFYLNIICHLANHFVAGGVGVRFVLDVWVCRNLRKSQPNREFVEAELKRFGLLEFAKNIEQLADVWFGYGEMTSVLEELGEYILTSGLHGTSQRAMLNAVSMSPRGNRSSAFMKMLFFSRAEMEDRFTWAKGKPWLLPVAWCVRVFKAITTHGTLIWQWGKGTSRVSRGQISKQQEKLARFGIKR